MAASRGCFAGTFAENELKKRGWTDGSGLGKDESGIKEAIKVKIKKDTTGVGHDPGAEFTDHWWNDVFNKAANSIHVNHGKEEVNIVKVAKSKEKHNGAEKAVLYGKFVKGATLTAEGDTVTEATKTKDGGHDSDQPDIRNSEEDLFKLCNGRTAHKAARHGFKLNGKLARIEKQELDSLKSKKDNKLNERKLANGKKKSANADSLMTVVFEEDKLLKCDGRTSIVRDKRVLELGIPSEQTRKRKKPKKKSTMHKMCE